MVRRRLGRVDIQCGAADVTALDRFDERGLVDQLTAGGVDQLQAFLAIAQPCGIEGVTGLRRRRHVQRQIVGARAQVVERHQLDVEFGRNVRSDERIVRDHGHLEGLGTTRDFLADSPQPGKPEDLAADFLAEKTLLVPLALFHGRIGGGKFSCQRQKLRHGELGHADAVRAWRVHDDDAARAGGLDVHIVNAGAGAGDRFEFLAGRDDFRRDFRGAAHDKCVSFGDVSGEFLGGSTGFRIDVPTFGFQEF